MTQDGADAHNKLRFGENGPGQLIGLTGPDATMKIDYYNA